MTESLEKRIGQKLLLSFVGYDGSEAVIEAALEKYRPAGFTLFRTLNITDPAQVRQLTDALQRKAQALGLPPLLIATDQEGGQLMAVGKGVTPLPGNMALGATGSEELARQAGEVLGRELAAMGINVDYAPCCDVNVNPDNPVIGTRSFGEDPAAVARLTAAMIEGIQSVGVVATAKHFPGHGDTAVDSHLGLPVVPHTPERLHTVELPPFEAAVASGVKMVMSAHLVLPAIDGPDAPPATLSQHLLTGLLREKMGYDGVIITDAMDMAGIRQDDDLQGVCQKAVMAGIDLLLMTVDPQDQQRAFDGLTEAVQTGQLDAGQLTASLARIGALKDWLAKQAPQPALDVVGCAAHLAVADEIAEKSITLVRDEAGLLPLQVDQRIAVVLPKPANLTPADTSASVKPALAEALRTYCPQVDAFGISDAPGEAETCEMMDTLTGYDLVVMGTYNAFAVPEQAAFVQQLLASGLPVVVAALRLPYDLKAFSEAPTYLCTYSILEPSMHALAKVLFGKIEPTGKLPVAIPGLYPVG